MNWKFLKFFHKIPDPLPLTRLLLTSNPSSLVPPPFPLSLSIHPYIPHASKTLHLFLCAKNLISDFIEWDSADLAV